MGVRDFIYRVVCSDCQLDRWVTYPQIWNILKGNNSGKCRKCKAKTADRSKVIPRPAWNKGLKGYMAGHPPYSDGQQFKGKKHTFETKEKMRLAKLGNPRPELSGTNHWNWKGGHSATNRQRDMVSLEYKTWRRAVFARDRYTCTECGATGDLQAHHIKPYAAYPELRHNVDNGLTLCPTCHLKTPTYGGGSNAICI